MEADPRDLTIENIDYHGSDQSSGELTATEGLEQRLLTFPSNSSVS